LPWLAAAVALCAVAAVVVVAATRSGSGSGRPAAPISASATLSPAVALFGSVVTAELTVSTDPRRVDPRTIGVDATFPPYTPLGRPHRRRTADGRTAVVRFTYRLQCLAAACSHPGGQAAVQLPPAVVTWRPSGRALVSWPQAAVASRLTSADLAQRSLHYATDSAGAGYRVDPIVVGWTAIAGAVLLLLAVGGGGAVRLRRRPEPPPVRPPTEVELALQRLDRARERGQAERRAAIGRLAEALEREGFPELTPLARRLAWSSHGPSAAVASELGLLVRAALETAP
jgi:hypothetical protein